MGHMRSIIPETESVRSQFVGNWIRRWKNENILLVIIVFPDC